MRVSVKVLTLALLLVLGSQARAAEDYAQYWNGVWNAEGTLFSVEVTVADDRVELRQLESLGFQWSSSAGRVAGSILEIEVDYAGVSGVIRARLEDANTAIVFARTCMPDFMVVCVLARDRQARFRKVSD